MRDLLVFTCCVLLSASTLLAQSSNSLEWKQVDGDLISIAVASSSSSTLEKSKMPKLVRLYQDFEHTEFKVIAKGSGKNRSGYRLVPVGGNAKEHGIQFTSMSSKRGRKYKMIVRDSGSYEYIIGSDTTRIISHKGEVLGESDAGSIRGIPGSYLGDTNFHLFLNLCAAEESANRQANEGTYNSPPPPEDGDDEEPPTYNSPENGGDTDTDEGETGGETGGGGTGDDDADIEDIINFIEAVAEQAGRAGEQTANTALAVGERLLSTGSSVVSAGLSAGSRVIKNVAGGYMINYDCDAPDPTNCPFDLSY